MELDDEQKELLKTAKEFKEMCQTEGWKRIESYIKDAIEQMDKFISFDTLPKDYNGFLEEVVKRRAIRDTWIELLNHVKNHIEGGFELEKQMKGGIDD